MDIYECVTSQHHQIKPQSGGFESVFSPTDMKKSLDKITENVRV